MLNIKRITFSFLWLLTILIAIIWTFENSDKVQSLKDAIKNEKIDQKH